jgi:hypothetical protein
MQASRTSYPEDMASNSGSTNEARGGCSPGNRTKTDASQDQEDWLRGRYQVGFEVSSFQPEGMSERWWTTFSRALASQVEALTESARGTAVEVEFAGIVSEPGEYGHMGMYRREFIVHAFRRPGR